jgi:hypothetical protein
VLDKVCSQTESQEIFKKYTGIFAISSKGVIGYEVYKKEVLIVIEWLILLTSL